MTSITGTSGNDTLFGTVDADVFEGSFGSDVISGGGGYNILDYRKFAGNYKGHPPNWYLEANKGPIVAVFDADGYSGTVTALRYVSREARKTDTFVDIHGILGTSGNDTLIGSDADDLPAPILLLGWGGSDTIDGRQSLLNLVSYASSFVGVVVHLETAQDADGGWSGSAIDGIGFLDGQLNGTHNAPPGLYPGRDTLLGVRRVEGSSFGDAITGSHVADLLDGGAGDDTLTGGAGDDTLIGGAGLDVAVFSGTSDQTQLQRQPDGSWVAIGLDGIDTLIGIELARFSDGEVWIGQTPPGDFNRDTKTDLLWQHANGQAAVWIMDGAQPVGGALIDTNPGAEWRAAGAGDFDGDGKADILWQHADGQAAVWTMDGTELVSSMLVGPNPGTSWHLA
jgi:Ca2+-binding RTX toxin-like protein